VSRFHSLARVVVAVLLLFAAMDLAFPAGCGDAPVAPSLDLLLCQDTGQSASDHPGDDCFCCSRTVRTTTVVTVSPSVQEVPVPVSVMPEPQSLAVRRLYHPPIA
jgi:hypothetical protein